MIKTIRKILKILDRKQRGFALVMVILMLFGALLESLGVSLVYPIVEAISSAEGWDETFYGAAISEIFGIEEHRSYIAFLIILTITVFVFKSVYLLFEKWVQNTFIARCRVQLQKKMMHRYLYKPYDFYLNSSSGEIIRIITSDTMETFSVLMSCLSIFTDGFICVVLAVTIIVMDPAISCVFIAVFVINFLVVSRLIKPVLSRIGNVNRKYYARANRWILESITGIKSVKVSNSEQFFEDMYVKNAEASIDSQRKSGTISIVPKLFNETFSVSIALAYVLVLVLSGAPLNNVIPILSVFAIAALRLMPCINNISYNMNTIYNMQGGLDNILKVIDEGESNDAETAEMQADEGKMPFENSIRLSEITFSYPKAEKIILDNSSMTIHRGEYVGIVGVSGGGKTTTADIILGLLHPEKGCVLVDGRDVADNIKGWRSIISYVPQQVFIMDDTVRNNIAFGVPEDEVSDERVWNAVKDAQLEDLVSELPEGIDTKVGERGVRLSGGQCQRLGIARALYRDPEVILFDEATSALDNETEAAIIKSIDSLKGTRTMIVIAHRLTTIKNCDRVYRIENGEIRSEK